MDNICTYVCRHNLKTLKSVSFLETNKERVNLLVKGLEVQLKTQDIVHIWLLVHILGSR